MKRLHLAIAVALLVALFVPLAASAQTITYTAGFQVQNLDTSNAATIQVTYYEQGGSTAASVSDSVPAGGSKTYFPLDAVSEGFNGSVVISSDRDVRAIANILGNGLDYGASYGGFTAGAPSVSLPLLMKDNGGFTTWFNVQNTGSAPTNVTVTYSDGVTGSCNNLAAGAACTLDQSTEGHAAGWVGSATVTTSGEPIAVTVMEVGATTLFAYNGFTSGSTDVAMPLINANNSGYITGVQIQNLGSTSTNVTVSYTPSSAGTACTETRSIPANQSETFALFAFTNGSGSTCTPGEKFVGSARISGNSTSQPLVAIVNQLNLDINKGAAYEGFDPAGATGSVVMPLIMDRNSNYFTGFSVANVGTSPTTVTCTFSGSTHVESDSLSAGEAMTVLQNGVISSGYVGSATCTASGDGKIVGVVNELNTVLTGDAFLVYDAFNQ
jgi:hypothetical protein